MGLPDFYNRVPAYSEYIYEADTFAIANGANLNIIDYDGYGKILWNEIFILGVGTLSDCTFKLTLDGASYAIMVLENLLLRSGQPTIFPFYMTQYQANVKTYCSIKNDISFNSNITVNLDNASGANITGFIYTGIGV